MIQLQEEWIYVILNVACFICIMTFGVSHGAIDNVLFEAKGKKENLRFISKYLLVAILLGVVWFFSPNMAFILFLITSAYHFGQSQFVEYSLHNHWSQITYSVWGTVLLSALLYFNQEELIELSTSSLSQISSLTILVDKSEILFFGSLASFVILMFLLKQKHQISWNNLLLEFYVLALICLSFKLLTVIIGFTLYFIILHSLRVLIHEYKYCMDKGLIKSNLNFTLLLMPFTIISLFGVAICIGALYLFDMSFAIPFVLVILTSCVTVPHTLVMDLFYRKSF